MYSQLLNKTRYSDRRNGNDGSINFVRDIGNASICRMPENLPKVRINGEELPGKRKEISEYRIPDLLWIC